jgi:hypothetical protein
MNATDFVPQFFKVLQIIPYPRDPWVDGQWTDFIGKVMDAVAESFGCYVARLKPGVPGESGEHLGIDHMFFSLEDTKRLKPNRYGGDPLALPTAVVESENGYDMDRIAYCLWKTTCLRAPLKGLICYQNGGDKVEQLRMYLEQVLREGLLADRAAGEVLVIIGDDSLSEKATWEEYFSPFLWNGVSLSKIRVQ